MIRTVLLPARGAAVVAALAALQACEVVSVTAVDVTTVQVSPISRTLHTGETLRLRVKLQDSEGNTLKERPVSWSSSNEAVAVVDSEGRVEALSVGEAVVKAVSGRAEGQATITVEALPTSRVESIDYYTLWGLYTNRHLRVSVLVVDHDGNPVPDAAVAAELRNVDRDESWKRSATTGDDGRAVLHLNRRPDGCYVTVIEYVSSHGLTWDGTTPENGYCGG